MNKLQTQHNNTTTKISRCLIEGLKKKNLRERSGRKRFFSRNFIPSAKIIFVFFFCLNNKE